MMVLLERAHNEGSYQFDIVLMEEVFSHSNLQKMVRFKKKIKDMRRHKQ